MTEEKIFTVIDDIKELIRSAKRELETCELCIKRNNRFEAEAKRKIPILQKRIEMLEKQLPMSVITQHEDFDECKWCGFCPRCQQKISEDFNMKYCGACGQAVEWE